MSGPSYDAHENGLWSFVSAAKISPLSSRVTSVDDTEWRVNRILREIPVTRVSDLTPLDELRLPVFSAVTPMARDLTTHLGKGVDAVSARVSALMEAVERVSAESVAPQGQVLASFEELQCGAGLRALDPSQFVLPEDSAYEPSGAFTWTEAFDLLNGERVLVPTDLVVSPPVEGVLRHVDTNGLASGNTLLEAVVHGLGEVIERDALSQHEFWTLFGEAGDRLPPMAVVDPDSVPGVAGEWIARARRAGLDFVIHDITTDVAVTTFRAYLIDSSFPIMGGVISARFPGFGTHLNAEIAVRRAVTEAIQSRLAGVQGARDAFNVFSTSIRHSTRLARAREISTESGRPFSESQSTLNDDLLADLNLMLHRLERVGIERVVVADLSRASLGLPVVRVRVPGLSCFAVNQRRVSSRDLRYLA
jgi:ribosomal protein S12 methylthiotransferase accessory factor